MSLAVASATLAPADAISAWPMGLGVDIGVADTCDTLQPSFDLVSPEDREQVADFDAIFVIDACSHPR